MSAGASFPSPGSGVPGAPPALKRALTPADGSPAQPAVDAVAAPQSATHDSSTAPTNLTAAAAMTGVAVGLEIARLISRQRRRNRKCGSRRAG
ncbi:hypothetical protein BVC93_07245 [Mycobacterium sp. MS1601]|nr:hypothetical protein BVC93_07245 [Mycobacterium sp. MS1601]